MRLSVPKDQHQFLKVNYKIDFLNLIDFQDAILDYLVHQAIGVPNPMFGLIIPNRSKLLLKSKKRLQFKLMERIQPLLEYLQTIVFAVKTL